MHSWLYKGLWVTSKHLYLKLKLINIVCRATKLHSSTLKSDTCSHSKYTEDCIRLSRPHLTFNCLSEDFPMFHIAEFESQFYKFPILWWMGCETVQCSAAPVTAKFPAPRPHHEAGSSFITLSSPESCSHVLWFAFFRDHHLHLHTSLTVLD